MAIIQNQTQSEQSKIKVADEQRQPNDAGTVHVEAHVRIFDPNTQKVYVEGRA